MSNNLIISEEKIRKILRTIITEELGIAREVVEATKKIEGIVDAFIYNNEVQ